MSEDAPGPGPRSRAISHGIAAILFVLATIVVFGDLWRAGPRQTVALRPAEGAYRVTPRADATFEAWLVARNARTLATRPHRVFDAEHCAPAEKTLTLGIPMLTLGLLGIPAALATDEAVLVYNLSIVALTLISAFAMYALATHWTGVAAAGWVAGLLFGFQPLRLGHITHPSVWDIAWTVLALLFAQQLFAKGRWRDAIGLGVAIALQIAASFYPLLAATFLTLPVLVWLLVRYGARGVGVAKLAVVGAMALLAAAAVLGPYLGAETDTGGLWRARFHYLEWSNLLDPSSLVFPGWCALTLAAVALLAGRRGAATGIRGDPRWALLVGALLATLVAAGSNNGPLPNLHALLAAVIPGLDAIRGIVRLTAGLHLALAVLAGLGAAALIRAAGPRAPWAAAALVAVAAFDVLRLPALGFERRYDWKLEAVRPHDRSIAFFEELARRGNRGPILELPLYGELRSITAEPRRILLSAWHHRRTSACFGSYQPPGGGALKALAAALPSPAAIAGLADLGFTTIVVHRDQPRPESQEIATRLERGAESAATLVPLHATPQLAAYVLRPAAGEPR